MNKTIPMTAALILDYHGLLKNFSKWLFLLCEYPNSMRPHENVTNNQIRSCKKDSLIPKIACTNGTPINPALVEVPAYCKTVLFWWFLTHFSLKIVLLIIILKTNKPATSENTKPNCNSRVFENDCRKELTIKQSDITYNRILVKSLTVCPCKNLTW